VIISQSMQKRSSKDENQLAKSVIDQIIEETENPEYDSVAPEKNPAAVALGRLGGLKGGRARAEALSPKKRSEIAKKAAAARWKKDEK